MSKIKQAKIFILHELLTKKQVTLDYLSKEISNNIGSLNIYEPVSQLRRRPCNYMIALSEDYKSYLMLQKLDGTYLFEDGYADIIAKSNNKMSSRELWRAFKHDNGYYYLENHPMYKDIPLKLIDLSEEQIKYEMEKLS